MNLKTAAASLVAFIALVTPAFAQSDANVMTVLENNDQPVSASALSAPASSAGPQIVILKGRDPRQDIDQDWKGHGETHNEHLNLTNPIDFRTCGVRQVPFYSLTGTHQEFVPGAYLGQLGPDEQMIHCSYYSYCIIYWSMNRVPFLADIEPGTAMIVGKVPSGVLVMNEEIMGGTFTRWYVIKTWHNRRCGVCNNISGKYSVTCEVVVLPSSSRTITKTVYKTVNHVRTQVIEKEGPVRIQKVVELAFPENQPQIMVPQGYTMNTTQAGYVGFSPTVRYGNSTINFAGGNATGGNGGAGGVANSNANSNSNSGVGVGIGIGITGPTTTVNQGQGQQNGPNNPNQPVPINPTPVGPPVAMPPNGNAPNNPNQPGLGIGTVTNLPRPDPIQGGDPVNHPVIF